MNTCDRTYRRHPSKRIQPIDAAAPVGKILLIKIKRNLYARRTPIRKGQSFALDDLRIALWMT